MKILSGSTQAAFSSADKTKHQTAQLELFLFNYLHVERKLITEEDFKKACGNALTGCKFPVELQVKLRRVYRQCLHNFLADKKDFSFLELLQKKYPQRYRQTQQYLKEFYDGAIR